MARSLWWVMAVVLGAGCALGPRLDLKALPGAKEYPDAQYVVLLSETLARFVPEGPGGAPQVVLTERWRVRILKPTVLPPLRAHYSRSFSRVESVRGRVIKPDGDEAPLDVSKQYDAPVFDGSVLFTDDRVVTVPVPPLAVGAVFESEIVTRRFDVKPYVLREWFGDFVPVKHARLVVTAPKAWLVRWQVQAWDGVSFAPVEDAEGELRRLTFEKHDLPALEPEGDSPAVYALVPAVSLRLEEWTEGGQQQQAFPTPEALSKWLWAQYEKQATTSAELEQTVKEVLAAVPDEPEAKARALYEHACRAIQYCAIEIGYGGWIPHDAASVQKSRYGDCKDKATYLHALLKTAGLSSAPTLIYAHGGSPMPFQLPSLGANFNHAILAVDLPGRTVYADPTWRVVPFGQLPPSDQEATVLELRPEGAPLKTTPASEAQHNLERQVVRLTLDALGNGAGTVTLEARGASALPVKSRLLTGTGKLSEWLGKELWNRTAHVETAKATRSGDFVDDAAVEGTLEARHLLLRGTRGDALLRPSDLFVPWTSPWREDRKTNVVYRHAETLESTLVLQLPPGAEVRALPADTELDSADARYRVRWRKDGASLEVTRTLVRKTRVIPAARLPENADFVRRVRRADHAAAVLRLPLVEASR